MFNCECSLQLSIGMFTSLYHANAVFCLTNTFWDLEYFKQLKIKCGQIFSTHWNSLSILSYMFLQFIIFIRVCMFFTRFLISTPLPL